MKQRLKLTTLPGSTFNRFRRGVVPVSALLLLAVLVLLLPVAMILSGQTTHFLPKASSDDAVVSLIPSSQKMPPNSNFQLFVDLKAHSLVFVQATVTFDPTKVKLVSEPTTGPSLTRLIQVTPTADANSKGKFTITVALDPSKKGIIPTGSVDIAGFQLKAVSTKQNDMVSITLDSSTAQLVDKDASAVTFTSQPAVITLNPTGPSSSPSPGITPPPSPKPTVKPPSTTPIATCRPRPPCLDTKPRCMIPITPDMCPPPPPSATPVTIHGSWVRSDGLSPVGVLTNCYLRLYSELNCQGTLVDYGYCQTCSTDGSGVCVEVNGHTTASFKSADSCKSDSCLSSRQDCRFPNYLSAWMSYNSGVFSTVPIVLHWQTY